MYFSTQGVRKSERKEAWLNAWCEVCGPFDVDFGEGDFHAEMDLRRVGGINAVRLLQTSRAARRSRADIPSEDRGFFLIFQCAGRSSVSQNGEELVLSPGQAALADSMEPLASKFSGKNVVMSFHIPRGELVERLDGGHVRTLQQVRGVMTPLLFSLLNSAYEIGDVSRESSIRIINTSILDLLAETIRSPELREPHLKQAPLTLKDRIKEFVLNNLRNPNLTPVLIASEFNVSERQIHRAFEADGMTVCRWIRQSRLYRCAAELQRDGHSRSITDIAFEWGFSDLPHFSRCFRNEFGASPREYRDNNLIAPVGAACIQ